MSLEYQIVTQNQITPHIRETFALALRHQGKVQGNLLAKADRCKLICIAKIGDEVAGIGALKIKTSSDFSVDKAALPELSKDFDWELGYIYTAPKYGGKGIAKTVCHLLVEAHGKENLMATTEVSVNPRMVKILQDLGFSLCGKQWKSAIHGNYLGLYLRYANVG